MNLTYLFVSIVRQSSEIQRVWER